MFKRNIGIITVICLIIITFFVKIVYNSYFKNNMSNETKIYTMETNGIKYNVPRQYKNMILREVILNEYNLSIIYEENGKLYVASINSEFIEELVCSPNNEIKKVLNKKWDCSTEELGLKSMVDELLYIVYRQSLN